MKKTDLNRKIEGLKRLQQEAVISKKDSELSPDFNKEIKNNSSYPDFTNESVLPEGFSINEFGEIIREDSELNRKSR